MNHDYAHCLDFKDDCPEDCFRAQLVRDLNDHRDKYPPTFPVGWMHMFGMNECKKAEEYLTSHPKAKKWIDEKIKELDRRWFNEGELD